MSQKATRKSATTDEKEKGRIDSPVRDMKKKMAANAEKEKLAAEKQNGDKPTEKKDNNKATDKQTGDKAADKKATDKQTVADKKPTDKPNSEKPAEKAGKSTEKKSEEKPNEGSSKAEKSTKPDQKESPKKPEVKDKEKPKQNGSDKAHNGVTDVTLSSKPVTDEVLNGAAGGTVKAARTPDTPRPPSDRAAPPPDPAGKTDQPKESTKLLKLNEDPSSSDRKLRSTDSPKRNTAKPQDSPKIPSADKTETSQKDDGNGKESSENEKRMEVIVLVEDCESTQGEVGDARKPDTNYSKSRVKVSPYRRSTRQQHHDTTSLIANYTGNNTTMEMDITESSIAEEPSVSEESSSYIEAIRNMRGRRSYKPLREMTLRSVSVERSRRRVRDAPPHKTLEQSSPRPTGTVVGRKRKPSGDDEPGDVIETARDVIQTPEEVAAAPVQAKRMRLLDKFVSPFRRTVASSTPLPQRRAAAPIVGINSDLPMSVPVPSAPADTFNPESLKNVPLAVTPAVTPVTPPAVTPLGGDSKRCVVM